MKGISSKGLFIALFALGMGVGGQASAYPSTPCTSANVGDTQTEWRGNVAYEYLCNGTAWELVSRCGWVGTEWVCMNQ